MALNTIEKDSLKEISLYLSRIKFDNERMIGSLDNKRKLVNNYNLSRVYNYKEDADTLVKLADSSVINFKYKANDNKGSLDKDSIINISIHINEDANGKKFAHIKAGVIENNQKGIVAFYKELAKPHKEKSSLLVSAVEPLDDVLVKLEAITKVCKTHRIPSRNDTRLLFFTLLSTEFNIDFLDVAKNRKSKSLTRAELEELHSVPELKEILNKIKGSAAVETQNELAITENSKEGKLIVDLTKQKEELVKEIKSFEPTYKKIKEAWAKERTAIEKNCGDDPLKLDVAYSKSTIRKEALDTAKKAKALKEKQELLEKKLTEAKEKLDKIKEKGSLSVKMKTKQENLEKVLAEIEKNITLDLAAQKEKDKIVIKFINHDFAGKIDIIKINNCISELPEIKENFKERNKEKYNQLQKSERRLRRGD